LKLVCHDASVTKRLQPGDSIVVHVALQDGRSMDLKTAVEAPRPRVNVLSKSVLLDSSGPPSTVRLESG
jgi:hypothetical protein